MYIANNVKKSNLDCQKWVDENYIILAMKNAVKNLLYKRHAPQNPYLAMIRSLNPQF